MKGSAKIEKPNSVANMVFYPLVVSGGTFSSGQSKHCAIAARERLIIINMQIIDLAPNKLL